MDFPNKATQFSKEHQPEIKGRPLGAKNRSTISKFVMGMDYKYPEDVLLKLKETYPNISNSPTIEEVMAVMQAKKAIEDGDTNAYKALMDSAYGAPKQETDLTTKGESLNNQYADLTDEEVTRKLNAIQKPINTSD